MKYFLIAAILSLMVVSCTETKLEDNRVFYVAVTTQHGFIDTLRVEATDVYLYEGNLYMDYNEGNRERRKTIASGVYKFIQINTQNTCDTCK